MSGSPALVLMSTTPLLLTLEWADGAVAEFAAVWLRDNLPQDRDPHSGQRLIDVVDLPAEPRIRRAAVVEGSLRVDWEDEAAPGIFDLDWLAQREFDIDIGAQLPHAALRVYVMGERGARRDPATPEDNSAMAEFAARAVRAGALGFSTSRTLNHRTSTGDYTPTLKEAELRQDVPARRSPGL